ncbi:MAG: thiamine-phosphate kinase, partial [Halobaculum sp.]
MNERDALGMLAREVPGAGDDAAVVGTSVLTTDMLHETTDFPSGVTRYTAGWRAVAASLSDVAAMGAAAEAAVAVYAAPTFEDEEIRSFVRGARDVCATADAEYVGGDLDETEEFTVSTTALGRTDDPVWRSGAETGDAVCVTGELGRTAAALELFERGEHDRGNDLFRFEPRVAAGVSLRPHATAMMDVSDGLARSLHQLGEASDCGFEIERDTVPIHPAVTETTDGPNARFDAATTVGEDFELLCTVPEADLDAAREECPTQLTRIGTVTERTASEDRVTVDG